MNTERANLINALREIASGSQRSKISRLREVFEEVEAAKSAGASNKVIVAALEARGLIFDVNNFKNARSRILKERAMEVLSQAAQSMSTLSPPITSIHPSGARTDPKKNPKATTTVTPAEPAATSPAAAGELQKPPGITDARWSEMKAQARADKRKQNQLKGAQK